MPASDVMSSFNATSHPTVLPAASYYLSAQSLTTPQALPISQNPSRQPPALCFPFPLSQLLHKQCLSPILPTTRFTPLHHLTSLSRRPLACNCYPSTTPRSSSHQAQSLHVHELPPLCCPNPHAKVSGVKTEKIPFSFPGSKHIVIGNYFVTADTRNS